MCEEVGLEVIRLKRIAIDTLSLGMLPQGQWRLLKEQEVKRLIQSAVKGDSLTQKEGDQKHGNR